MSDGAGPWGRSGPILRPVSRIGISHDRDDEDLLAKARWFSQFSPEERLRMLIEWSDAMLALNPQIAEVGRAYPIPGRIQVLERP